MQEVPLMLPLNGRNAFLDDRVRVVAALKTPPTKNPRSCLILLGLVVVAITFSTFLALLKLTVEEASTVVRTILPSLIDVLNSNSISSRIRMMDGHEVTKNTVAACCLFLFSLKAILVLEDVTGIVGDCGVVIFFISAFYYQHNQILQAGGVCMFSEGFFFCVCVVVVVVLLATLSLLTYELACLLNVKFVLSPSHPFQRYTWQF